jgi:hypothetical protein
VGWRRAGKTRGKAEFRVYLCVPKMKVTEIHDRNFTIS